MHPVGGHNGAHTADNAFHRRDMTNSSISVVNLPRGIEGDEGALEMGVPDRKEIQSKEKETMEVVTSFPYYRRFKVDEKRGLVMGEHGRTLLSSLWNDFAKVTTSENRDSRASTYFGEQ
jgi:hypothetical protein